MQMTKAPASREPAALLAPPLVVLKIGGSVFTSHASYRRVAAAIGTRLHDEPGVRFVVVVSAELGSTDTLLATAQDLAPEPDPVLLDLLWSTGELRSTALLALALQAIGIHAAAANIHQAGLIANGSCTAVRPLRLRALAARHAVVVTPGFLARGTGDAVVSLGRGGSDLTAVLLAAGLGADRCELVKDVPGYFSADPHGDPDARHLPALTYGEALAMAEAGCELVQRQALEAARDAQLDLTIRALGDPRETKVGSTAAGD
ncbi:hypothetical protein BH23ACI1_BH23ACI1_08320 [soil metagenome]